MTEQTHIWHGESSDYTVCGEMHNSFNTVKGLSTWDVAKGET